MLKKLQSNLWKLSLIIWVVMGSNALWGQTYSYTFSSSQYTASPQTKTLGTADWTLTNNGSYYGIDSTKGQQIGSAGNPASSMTFATSSFSGVISTVKIYTSGAASVTATVSVAVGGTAYGSASTISATNTGYTFTGSSSGQIVITWSNTSAKALYIKQVDVTYVNNAAPTATSVANAGSLVVGQTLTGSYTYNDADSDAQGTSTYKWYRADSSSGTNAAAISGATGTSYVLTSTDLNKYISFAVVPVAATGTTTGTETFSSYRGPVTTTTPTVTASGTLAAVPTTYGTASSTTTFTASGANLTAPIIITAPNGYEISTASASGFGSSVSLTPTSGTVSATTIYVRIAATTTVGSYSGNITLSSASTPAASATIATVSSAVSAKALTITGLTGGNKVYDALLTAPVSGTATLNGVVNNDAITLSGTPAYNFTTKAVGTNSITVTGYTITGTNASSYTVTQPTSLTGTITAKSVTVTGATAQDKTYDGTATATISGGTVVGAITNDAVSVSTTGTFASTNAGSGIGVTIALTGNDATNYTLTQPGLTAKINKANPVYNSVGISVGINNTYTLPGGITTTSDGTLSYSITNTAIATVSGTTINGVAVGSTVLNVNQAASTNYNAGSTTYTINVTTITYNNGDFMSSSDGIWSSTTANNTINWKTYSTSLSDWVASSSAPSASNSTNTIYIASAVTLQGTNTAKNIVVVSGGVFNAVISCTFTNVTIKSGGIFNKSANSVTVNGVLEVEDNGTLNFNHTNSTSRSSTIWAGTEKFHANSNFVVKTCDSGSNFLVIQDPADVSEYNGACFGNFIVDMSAGQIQILPAAFTRTLANNFILRTYSNSGIRGSSGTYTFALLNDFIIENTYTTTFSFLNSTGTATINIGGDIIHGGSNALRMLNNTSGIANVNVKGDITLTGNGSLDINFASGGVTTFNLEGDITVPAGATFFATQSTAANNIFNFTGTGNGSTAATTQTIDIATTAATKNQYINFAAKSGSYVQLASNLTLGTTGKFTAEAGSVFDTQAYSLSGPTFVTAATSTVTTANTSGLTGAIATTAATYTAGTHYIFNAATTTPFPTETFGNPANVITNANVTLNRTLAPTGSVTVNSGIFDLDAYTIDRATSGNTITLGSGSTLKINGTNGFPANYATQVFGTNSTVHFAGDSQPVKKLTAEYYNVRLSGTGTKTFDNETIVGNNLTLENGPSVTLAANKTLTVRNQVTNNGTENNFIIEDNGALVQTNNVANSGYITAHKNSNVLYRQDYTMWSAPTTGTQTIGSISPGTLETRFYEYDCRNSGSGYVEAYYHVNPATDTFTAGHSYLIRMPNVDTTPDYNTGGATLVIDGKFTGTPNNGTITRSLNTHADRFTSTGNPYPSPIGITEFFAANNTVLESGSGIYLWRKKNNGLTGSYATVSAISYAFNSSNGSTTGGQINDQYFNGTATSTWRIAPAQGFLVKTAASATGTPVVTFNNGMRKSAPSSGGQSFFRTGTQSISRYWINLIDNENSVSQFTVAYAEDATNGIDYGYDAFRLGEANTFAAYTIAEEKDLTIQARPDFVISDQVKMGYIATQPGTYTLSLSNKDGIFADGQNIYIKDNQEGIIRELTGNGYAFGTEAGTFNERFTILYTNQVLDTDNPSIVNNNVTVFKNNSSIVADAGNDIINSIEVYDIQGRRIFANSNINASNYSINGLNASHEMLIVKVATNKGTVSKKIIF